MNEQGYGILFNCTGSALLTIKEVAEFLEKNYEELYLVKHSVVTILFVVVDKKPLGLRKYKNVHIRQVYGCKIDLDTRCQGLNVYSVVIDKGTVVLPVWLKHVYRRMLSRFQGLTLDIKPTIYVVE